MPEYRSRTTTRGRNMAGARALWRATGMQDGDFDKPIIAVVNSFTQFVPGHVHFKDVGQPVAREIEAAAGGAVGLVEDGDVIDIDIPNRRIDVRLNETELNRRRAAMEARGERAWQPVQERPRKVSAALKVYAQLATSADKGAVRDLDALK